MRKLAILARTPLLVALLTALLVGLAAAQPEPPVPADPARGLAAVVAGTSAAPAVQLRSPERFELTIDGAGIVSWVSRATGGGNLVPAGARLVEHTGADGAPFAGSPRLLAASPVRAVVRIDGPGGSALTYTVWAGGQVSIEPSGAPGLRSELRLGPDTAAGAALRPIGDGALLYLDAWTPDAVGEAALASGQLDATGTILAERAGPGPVVVTAPEGVLRQPRLRVAGWPGPDVAVELAGRRLVHGADYLADWDAATGELTLQYLGLLTPGAEAARTFSIGTAQAAAIGVEILTRDGAAARTLSPEGLLRVDANVPSQTAPAPGTPTTKDIFDIPYIQTWPELRLRATVESPPAGFGGVRFTVAGPGLTRAVDDTTPADGFTAVISLPRRAEYSLTVSALVGGAPAEPSRTIGKVAYGRVFVGVGDSITSGKWGFYRLPGGDGYPFVAPPAAGSGFPVSADGRNYPQSDNSADDLVSGVAGYENAYYAGYLPELNDRLSTCLNSPVFILNDGSSGIRTARDTWKTTFTPTQGNPGKLGFRNVLGKTEALRSHLRQLGAGQILLQVGTNDATTVISNTSQFNDPMPGSLYNQDLRSVITALRQDDPSTSVFVARLPWRNDRRGSEPAGIEAQKQAKTQEFNAEIVKVVDDLDAAAPVFLGPDFYAHFAQNQGQIIATDPTDTTPPNVDLIHPTSEGFSAMALLWSQAICQQIPAEPPPTDDANLLYLPLVRR